MDVQMISTRLAFYPAINFNEAILRFLGHVRENDLPETDFNYGMAQANTAIRHKCLNSKSERWDRINLEKANQEASKMVYIANRKPTL